MSEVHVKGWFGVGYDLCVCGGRVLSVQLGKRKERDEDEGEQEEARTVGGVHVGGWVVICVLRCCVFSSKKKGARGRGRRVSGGEESKRMKKGFCS